MKGTTQMEISMARENLLMQTGISTKENIKMDLKMDQQLHTCKWFSKSNRADGDRFEGTYLNGKREGKGKYFSIETN